MATIFEHLSVEELEERFVGCQDATASRHFQVIWLLARGHTRTQRCGVMNKDFSPEIAEEIIFASRAFMRRLADGLPPIEIESDS